MNEKTTIIAFFFVIAIHLTSTISLTCHASSRFFLFDPESDLIENNSHLPGLPLGLDAGVWPQFREAPAYSNGKDCPQPDLIYTTFININENENETTTPTTTTTTTTTTTISTTRITSDHHLCDTNSVHIALTLDVAYIRGSVAAILSIVKHSACPENVVFHFLASEYKAELSQILSLTFPYLKFKIYNFDTHLVKDRISASIREALEQPLNYARTYLADILPSCVKRVIYLDSDVIVLDDIVKLWETDLDSHPIGAPEYCRANFTKYFTDIFWSDPELAGVFEGRKPCYFNTGVMVMDLDMWREWGYTKWIEEWMEIQKDIRIYELGSLPPFLLVFAGDVQPIEHKWNQHGLGGDNYEGNCRTLQSRGATSLMHWSGKGKPWVRLDYDRPCSYDSVWAAYDLALKTTDMRK